MTPEIKEIILKNLTAETVGKKTAHLYIFYWKDRELDKGFLYQGIFFLTTGNIFRFLEKYFSMTLAEFTQFFKDWFKECFDVDRLDLPNERPFLSYDRAFNVEEVVRRLKWLKNEDRLSKARTIARNKSRKGKKRCIIRHEL